MKYGVRDALGLVRTPVGRARIKRALRHGTWPLSSRLASLHRRLVVPRTRVVVVIGSLGKSAATHAVSAALELGQPRGEETRGHRSPSASSGSAAPIGTPSSRSASPDRAE